MLTFASKFFYLQTTLPNNKATGFLRLKKEFNFIFNQL